MKLLFLIIRNNSFQQFCLLNVIKIKTTKNDVLNFYLIAKMYVYNLFNKYKLCYINVYINNIVAYKNTK